MIRIARRGILALAAVLAAAIGGTAPAAAADMVVGVYVSDPGVCANQRVLNRISHRFRHQVTHVPHLPQVDIVDFQGIRETRFFPRYEESPIERRYCQATVALSDGYSRDVWYLIERPMGFAGFGSNVEFCVSGFDRWNVYGGRCRVLH
ncbi:hypothetical protein [Aquamicrobium sp. LC103]|uniref:hypothetical protein n=1 Tax=Aquamicrobium sp. LC103 TaxID=1120658 RepID=UPI0010C95DEF|nr:hypothetical protein [Aquamicrobium sp. LC103]TKT81377.1 hypothetical protein XW59_005815 [Aquamicrobium sp. LC103]